MPLKLDRFQVFQKIMHQKLKTDTLESKDFISFQTRLFAFRNTPGGGFAPTNILTMKIRAVIKLKIVINYLCCISRRLTKFEISTLSDIGQQGSPNFRNPSFCNPNFRNWKLRLFATKECDFSQQKNTTFRYLKYDFCNGKYDFLQLLVS